MFPSRASSTRRSALTRGLVTSAVPSSSSTTTTIAAITTTTTTTSRGSRTGFFPSHSLKTGPLKTAAPQSTAPHSSSLARSPSSDQASRIRRNPLVKQPAPNPIPPQLFLAQWKKRKSGRMNFGSHNVVIPGLTLVNSSLSPSLHLPPVAPLLTTETHVPTQDQISTSTSASASTSISTSTPTPSPLNPDVPNNSKKGKKSKAPPHTQPDISNQAPDPSISSPSSKPSTPKKNKPKKFQSGDDRQTPSQESGGVPDPHPLYLAKSLAPPIRVSSPRRMLVIMDLNGTLLYRPNKRNPFNFIQRPHARAFMDYCLSTFHVAIWSSARPENVSKMVAQLLSPAQRARLVVIWGRDRFGLSPADYDSRVQCYKRLSSIWADPDVRDSHPLAAQGQRWDQTNTVLVDDSIEKARSEPHNLLEIPEFTGIKHETVDVLPQVHEYLNQCCFQADVSRFIRQSPFKLDLHHGARY